MASKERHSIGTADHRSITGTAPKAFLIMLLSGLFLLLIFTALSINTGTPTEISPYSAPAALFLGCLIGGGFCGIYLKTSQKYACAALSAVILTAILLTAKLFIDPPSERLSLAVTAIMHVATVFCALLGACVEGYLPKKRRSKKSKYRSKK